MWKRMFFTEKVMLKDTGLHVLGGQLPLAQATENSPFAVLRRLA